MRDEEKKNVFRYLGEGYAYLVAFVDDSILLGIQKLQKKAEAEVDVNKKQKLHEKALKMVGKSLSYTLGEAGSGFYEKYADLKKGDNLAATAIDKKLPNAVNKGKLSLTKMDLIGIEKGDLNAIKKLKRGVSIGEKIKMKKEKISKKIVKTAVKLKRKVIKK